MKRHKNTILPDVLSNLLYKVAYYYQDQGVTMIKYVVLGLICFTGCASNMSIKNPFERVTVVKPEPNGELSIPSTDKSVLVK